MQQQLGQGDRFQAVQRIDAGGMGEVWEADDALLGRRVAIKVLAEELAGDSVALRRFRREARATAMLDHPNVVPGVRLRGRRGAVPRP
jgi:serine/threonine protein kinase